MEIWFIDRLNNGPIEPIKRYNQTELRWRGNQLTILGLERFLNGSHVADTYSTFSHRFVSLFFIDCAPFFRDSRDFSAELIVVNRNNNP
jgi:hypothetical protein